MAGTPPHWTSDPQRDSSRDSRDSRPDRDDRHGDRRGDDRGERRYARDPRPDSRRDDGHDSDSRWSDARYHDHVRVDNGRAYARERFRGGYYQAPRGYYRHAWVRGERLPPAFYARPYLVYGYRGYHLYDPPRGYYWVRVNNDVVLTAIATGIVLDVVYNLYY